MVDSSSGDPDPTPGPYHPFQQFPRGPSDLGSSDLSTGTTTDVDGVVPRDPVTVNIGTTRKRSSGIRHLGPQPTTPLVCHPVRQTHPSPRENLSCETEMYLWTGTQGKGE